MKKVFLLLLSLTISGSYLAVAQNTKITGKQPQKSKKSSGIGKKRKTKQRVAVSKAEPKPQMSLVNSVYHYTAPTFTEKSGGTLTSFVNRICIPVRLKFPDEVVSANDTFTYKLETYNLPDNPKLYNATHIVSMSRKGKGIIDGEYLDTVIILTDAWQDTLSQSVFGVLTISGRAEGQVIISCEKSTAKGSIRVHSGAFNLPNTRPIEILANSSKTAPVREQIIYIPVQLVGQYPGDTANRFVFVIDSCCLLNQIQINPLDTAQTISQDEWADAVTNHGGNDTFAVRVITNGKSDTSADRQTTFIGVKGIAGEMQQIDLVTYNPNKPFWIEFGANFDLASQQLQPTNLFGGVFLYKKDVTPLFNHGGSNNFAVAAGVYESKNFSQSTTVSAFKILPYIDSTSYPSGHSDSGRVYTDSGNVKMTSQIRNIGLFFSPQVRLTNKDAGQDGIHLFASFYAEMLWQDVQVNYDYSQTRRIDTEWVSKPALGSYSGKNTSREFNFYSHYEGFGVPIFFKEGDANLYLNPVFGVSNQPSTADIANVIDSAGSAIPRNKWRAFYLVQFRLSEEKYGLSFSGEIRQLIGAKSEPFITLVLSKKFDLSKLINFQ